MSAASWKFCDAQGLMPRMSTVFFMLTNGVNHSASLKPCRFTSAKVAWGSSNCSVFMLKSLYPVSHGLSTSSTEPGIFSSRSFRTSSSTSALFRCTSRPFHGANAQSGGMWGRPESLVNSLRMFWNEGPAKNTTRRASTGYVSTSEPGRSRRSNVPFA